ncbi:MAG: nuclear transport factor 2 family protein [Streptosporangiaceae bacterium]
MTATTTQETRQLIARFLQAHEHADAPAIRELITEDATWHLPPSADVGPFTGAGQVSAALAGGAADHWLDTATIKRNIIEIIVDGDTAVALESKTATTHGGDHYANDYCWVYTCREGLISQIRNFTDTLHADRLFGLDNKTPTAP